jgi:mono/diheme cytochrome c family protein
MHPETPHRAGRFRWASAALLAVGIAAGIYHADLLKAAVTSNPFSGSPESISRGGALWKQDCEACHGANGRGDGPVTASLRKHPKDLTRIALAPVFPDGVVAYRIANGGEVMPAWKSVLSSGDIWDLVSFIRAQRR